MPLTDTAAQIADVRFIPQQRTCIASASTQVEVIALASDFSTASSAYEEAVKRRPGKIIILRQKARVIKKSR